MNANQIYQLKAEDTTNEIYSILSHLHEIHHMLYDISWDWAPNRIEVRTIKYVCTDGRRTYHLRTIWFNEKPVMIVQNAGRDDCEYTYRYITNFPLYKEMCKYLISIVQIDFSEAENDVIDPNENKKWLTYFYSQDHVSGGI